MHLHISCYTTYDASSNFSVILAETPNPNTKPTRILLTLHMVWRFAYVMVMGILRYSSFAWFFVYRLVVSLNGL